MRFSRLILKLGSHERLILKKMTEIRINVLVASSTINGDIVDTKLVTYNEEAH